MEKQIKVKNRKVKIHRPKRLLVMDIEGTLFKTKIRLPGTQLDSTIWQALAQSLGSSAIADEVATHQKWSNGHYVNYMEWMRETIEIHRKHGLTEAIFKTVLKQAEYSDGINAFFSQLDREYYEVILVSGGFRDLAIRAQVDFDIHHTFTACEYFFNSRGRLSGYNLLPCDFLGKNDFIKLMLREYRLGPKDWLFVGDGYNDVPVASAAPYSVAFKAHPALREVSSIQIDSFEELTQALEATKNTE